MNSVLVFGSINLDISVTVPRLPMAGETVVGARLEPGPGGKGANQAHAARLYGARVNLVGAVGDDEFAVDALRGLERVGVGLGAVRRMQGVATGIACIAVGPDGANQIVVAPGANELVRAAWVSDALLAESDLLLLQNEVGLAHALPLIGRFKSHGRTVVLNLAPVHGQPAWQPGMVDWLVLNEHELAQLQACLGLAPAAPPQVGASAVAARCACTVVVTLGAAGALACKPSGATLSVPAPPVDVVDTTGAGDTFCGTLAAALAGGAGEQAALAAATTAASLSCRSRGAQAAQPTRHEIDQALALQPPTAPGP